MIPFPFLICLIQVSIYGHSLGSVLSYDILCHQENLSSPFPMDCLYQNRSNCEQPLEHQSSTPNHSAESEEKISASLHTVVTNSSETRGADTNVSNSVVENEETSTIMDLSMSSSDASSAEGMDCNAQILDDLVSALVSSSNRDIDNLDETEGMQPKPAPVSDMNISTAEIIGEENDKDKIIQQMKEQVHFIQKIYLKTWWMIFLLNIF